MTISKFGSPQRDNSGIILPEMVIHAALSDLPRKFAMGEYAKGYSEEPIVKVISGLSQTQIDSVFESLRRKPPSVGLEFPTDTQALPAIFIATESMVTYAPKLADDVGQVAPDINTNETEYYFTESAVGGESKFFVPCVGELVGHLLTLYKIPSGGEYPGQELEYQYDFVPDSTDKSFTLSDPLAAGDALYASRWASLGLAGGDLYGTTFECTLVVFIDAENPIVTSVLKGLVWRELVLKTASVLSAGLVDLGFSVRYQSIYQELKPAIGHRFELVLTCLTTWIAYDRLPIIKSFEVEPTDAGDVSTAVLELSIPLVRWPETEE